MKDFDNTPYEDIIDMLNCRGWISEREKRESRRGSRTQQAEDNVLRENKFI